MANFDLIQHWLLRRLAKG